MPSRRGWRWDGANSRLDVDVDGTTVARFDDGTGDIEIVSGTINVADGGTVGQDTSKSTAVELNTHSGQITMDDAALADDAVVSLTVTNSNIAATDVVIVNHSSGGTLGVYVVQAHTIASGSFKISVENISGGSLAETPIISFAVIKGASS